MPFDERSIAEVEGQGSSGAKSGADLGVTIGGATPFDTEQVQRFHDEAKQIKAAAERGEWAIDEDGMQAYLKACDAFLDRYDEMRGKAQVFAQRPKMGSHPYAYKVADFTVSVFMDAERGLVPNLELMADGYKQAREALEIARRNYDEAEQSYVQRLGKLVVE